MKIQKGIVKYKDRNDIVCTYGVADDGTQYYFLDDTDDKKLSNGNHIVSTALVEAVDSMVKATHIGMINKDGEVLLPCENKGIKMVSDNVLIVEKAFPTSQNVLEALEKRSDTATAPSLVSSSAAIKDKMNSKMGAEGRFLINDQFSEATVCDMEGKNLVNDEYYSYIGFANNELYLCKNTPESDIVEFSITDGAIKDAPKSEEVIDIQNTEVDPNTVEGALANEETTTADDSKEKVKEDNVGGFAPLDLNDFFGKSPSADTGATSFIQTDNPQESQEISPTDMPPVVDAEDVADVVEGKVELEDTSKIVPPVVNEEAEQPEAKEEVVEEKVEEAPVSEEVPTVPEVAEDSVAEEEPVVPEEVVNEAIPEVPVEEVKEENVAEEKVEETPVSEEVPEDNTISEKVEESIPEEPVEEVKEETVATKENDLDEFSSQIENDLKEVNNVEEEPEVKFNENVTSVDPDIVSSTVDKDKNGVLDSKESSNYKYDNLKESKYNYDDYGAYSSSFSSDTLMSDVARSMSELMRQNREQKVTLADMGRRLEESESERRMLAKRYDSLTNKLRSLDGLTGRLEKKIKEQTRMLESKDKELKSLRSEINSKQDLAKLVADAKELLGEEDYSYSDDSTYYRRAA